jgi:hypothetical protein
MNNLVISVGKSSYGVSTEVDFLCKTKLYDLTSPSFITIDDTSTAMMSCNHIEIKEKSKLFYDAYSKGPNVYNVIRRNAEACDVLRGVTLIFCRFSSISLSQIACNIFSK